jgi:hypothetical protein
MNLSQYLSQGIQDIFLDGTWIANTNYKAQISHTNFELMQRQIGTLNSIAVLTQHVHYYLKGILEVVKGGPLSIKDVFSFDFPDITSQAQWDVIIETFLQDAQELSEEIKAKTTAQLEAPFVDDKYGTLYRNIDGLLGHSYYHLGQIALIKKMIEEGS